MAETQVGSQKPRLHQHGATRATKHWTRYCFQTGVIITQITQLRKGIEMEKIINQVHQGDVYLYRVEKLPDGIKPRKDRTLKLGETTGHHHTLTGGTVFGVMESVQWVVVDDEGVKLEHQPTPGVEHRTVPVPVGVWLVPVQVADDGEKERRAVMD